MAGTHEGRVENVHEGGATPTNDPDDDVEGYAGALPCLQVEQLRARHKEIEDARLKLEQECVELERHEDGGRACAIAHDINQRIS